MTTTDTRPAAFSTVERATPYTVGDPDAAALEVLSLSAERLAAISAAAHRIDVDPALLPGVSGLFSASVSLPDPDADRRGARNDGATLYLSPVAAFAPMPGYTYRPTNDHDVRTAGVEWDSRAVRVEGMTQGVAGFRVNGKNYTGTLEVRTFTGGTRWVYGPSSGLSDAASRRLTAAADALADAYLTPATLAAAAVTLTVSTLQHATRAAMRAEAVRTDALRRTLAALTAL